MFDWGIQVLAQRRGLVANAKNAPKLCGTGLVVARAPLPRPYLSKGLSPISRGFG
ncbi:MAG: hypothetical protein ACFB0E_09955 [Leptolyngbyaceae cyanobacterium]